MSSVTKPELGEAQFREAHIPGALFAHLERDLSAPKTGTNGRHPLPDPGAFIAWLGQQGLEPSDQVVCYDAGNGAMAADAKSRDVAMRSIKGVIAGAAAQRRRRVECCFRLNGRYLPALRPVIITSGSAWLMRNP